MIICIDVDCEVSGGRKFYFSDKEKEFYAQNKFLPPRRCWECRTRRRTQKESPFAGVLKDIKQKEQSDKEMLA